ncbi:MAG: TonB-dependent receptor [Marinobacterium sp.]|nr:TonB-dependent receptor [Marinobacterium sp.]
MSIYFEFLPVKAESLSVRVECLSVKAAFRPFRHSLLTLSISLASAAAIGADSALQTADDLVITGTRIVKPAHHLTQPVTVINGETIRERGYNDFTEVLRSVPGIEFKQAGGPGQFNYIKMRGFSSGNILFVLDGVILNEGSTGDVRSLIGQLDTTIIDKIEVLRGPQAALYGANSTAGVISITTRDGSERQINLGVQGGSLGWGKLKAGLNDSQALAGGTLRYAANLSTTDSNNVHAHEFFEDDTIQLKVSWDNDSLQSGISYFKTDNRFGYAELDEPYSALIDRSEHWSFQTPDPHQSSRTEKKVVSSWLRHTINERWQQGLRISKTDHLYNIGDKPDGLLGYARAPFDGFTFDVNQNYSADVDEIFNKGDVIAIYDRTDEVNALYKGESRQLNYDLQYQSDRLKALIGAEYLRSEAAQSGSYGNLQGKASHRSLYLNGEYTVVGTDLVLAGGLRNDNHENWGSHITGSMGMSYRSVFANIATSFKAPTLTHLYNLSYGNTSVQPEEGRTLELGFRQRLADGKGNWEATLWRTELDDVIFYDSSLERPNAPGRFGRYSNGDKQRTQGVELSGRYQLTDNIGLWGNYTFTDSDTRKNSADWLRTVQIASNKANLGMEYRQGRLDVNTQLSYSGPRLRWKGDIEMASWLRTDVSARYAVTDQLSLFGRVENLFDVDIEEGLGYEQPGVYGLVGVDYDF